MPLSHTQNSIRLIQQKLKDQKPAECKKKFLNIFKNKIKIFDSKIKQHYSYEKHKKVRGGILPGNSKLLWAAACISKDQNLESFPSTLHNNGIKLTEVNVPDDVASFFDNKLEILAQSTQIDPNIYNAIEYLV